VCKKHYGIKNNYILAMYYIANLETLGETKIITYCNKFINNKLFGCKYIDQEWVNKLEPIIEDVIPNSFIEMLKKDFF
jgi:hypothetical protein